VPQIITPGDLTQPKIVTFKQLATALEPFLAVSNREATLELHDLWKMGAPTPDSGPGVEEKRILFPNQFSKWWKELCRRQGWDVTPQEAYRGRAAASH